MRTCAFFALLMFVLGSCTKRITVSSLGVMREVNGIARKKDGNLVIAGLDARNSYGGRGYISFANGVLSEVDVNGKLLWQENSGIYHGVQVHGVHVLSNNQLLVLTGLRKTNRANSSSIQDSTLISVFDQKRALKHQIKIKGKIFHCRENKGQLFMAGLEGSYYEPKLKQSIYQPVITTMDLELKKQQRFGFDIRINTLFDMFFAREKVILEAGLYSANDGERFLIECDLLKKDKEISCRTTGRNVLGISKANMSYALKDFGDSTGHEWVVEVINHQSYDTLMSELGALGREELVALIDIAKNDIGISVRRALPGIKQLITNDEGEVFLVTMIYDEHDHRNLEIMFAPEDKATISRARSAYSYGDVKGLVVLKLSKEGKLLWKKRIAIRAIPLCLNDDGEGGIYVGGSVFEAPKSGQSKALLMHLDGNGDVLMSSTKI